MKTILTMPSPELALLTMTGEGKPFVLNRRTMAELEALLDEVRRLAPRALVLTGEGRFFCAGADIRTRPCRAPRPHPRDLRIIR